MKVPCFWQKKYSLTIVDKFTSKTNRLKIFSLIMLYSSLKQLQKQLVPGVPNSLIPYKCKK